VPLAAVEACQVPLWEFRAWLDGDPVVADAGDVEGAIAPSPRRQAADNSVLRWDGVEDGAASVRADRLRPGDVIALQADAGGYDAFGWAPASREIVPDLADEAFLQRTGRKVERLADPEAEGDRVHRWSGGVVVETFTDQPRSRVVPREVRLDRHAKAVAERARAYAAELGLDEDELFRAGLHHDAGKAHPGWQLQVNGGDLRRLDEPPLAKGEMKRSPLSRLPRGWRHEAESLRHLPAGTSDLVAWLVATHHGHARPSWPIAAHGIGLAELMEKLQADLGYWRLALHEAALRCADRAVSREEMEPVLREETKVA
jgi:CRISPR-associated endonuclease/helicase Cas3